jgi:hypothetical protein
MKLHGGEPVPDPNGTSLDEHGDPAIPGSPFCASLRSCSFNTDCADLETCDTFNRTCVLRNRCSDGSQCAIEEFCDLGVGICSSRGFCSGLDVPGECTKNPGDHCDVGSSTCVPG